MLNTCCYIHEPNTIDKIWLFFDKCLQKEPVIVENCMTIHKVWHTLPKVMHHIFISPILVELHFLVRRMLNTSSYIHVPKTVDGI